MTTGKHVLFIILLQLSSGFAIYNGEKCPPEYYKFVVQVVGHKGNKPTFKCTGTLIQLNTVLGAAHCVHKFKSSIFAEPRAILKTLKGKRIIGTKEIHIHEKYDHIDLQYDVAILILEEYFSPSEASIIQLPVNHKIINLTEGVSGTFIGWGNTKQLGIDEDVHTSYGSLSCITLSLISQENCSLLRTLVKFDTYFCTFPGLDRVGGGCPGDSGGPFLFDGVQYGIASANFGCGVIGEPTFFTRIETALDFIERHLKSFAVSVRRNRKTNILELSAITFTIFH